MIVEEGAGRVSYRKHLWKLRVHNLITCNNFSINLPVVQNFIEILFTDTSGRQKRKEAAFILLQAHTATLLTIKNKRDSE